MTTRTRTRAAALVTAAVMSLSLASPSLAASSDRAPVGTVTVAQAERAPAQLAKKASVKQTRAALAKAKKQQKKARAQVRARTSALTTAREVAALWAEDLRTATEKHTAARTSHTLILLPLNRYRETLANSDAVWADYQRRLAAGQAQETAARAAFEAAQRRLEGLRSGSYGLQVQLDEASTSLRAAAATVTRIQTVDIPDTEDRIAESRANEAKLTEQSTDADAAFEDAKTANPGSELRDGHWGHQVDGTWVALPELDKLDADARALRQAVVQAGQTRATWERFRTDLDGRLAKAHADVESYGKIVASLQDQIANFSSTVAAAEADFNWALTAMNQARETAAALKVEGGEISAEVTTARREEPALAVTEKKLAEALATATTTLNQATRENKAAQAAVKKGTRQVTKAKKKLRKATKQVKRLKRQLKSRPR